METYQSTKINPISSTISKSDPNYLISRIMKSEEEQDRCDELEIEEEKDYVNDVRNSQKVSLYNFAK